MKMVRNSDSKACIDFRGQPQSREDHCPARGQPEAWRGQQSESGRPQTAGICHQHEASGVQQPEAASSGIQQDEQFRTLSRKGGITALA